MAIDKAIDYVEQDGYKNYIKNSKSVTVPKEFKSRSDATPTKLAYITKDEAKMLKKIKKGTPHKGPKGIPSYDDYDAATGSFRSGAAMSAAETGGRTERDRADMRAAGIGPQEAQDLRSAAIAAGAGQRVNPGFFDSRNTVSPTDLRLAKAFNPTAFRQNRGSGLLNFIRSGGILGNLVRNIGQRLGFGKRFNEPTYDMRQFNDLGLLTDRVNPVFDDGSNEDLLSLVGTGGITDTIDLGNPKNDKRIVPEEQGLEGDGSYKISSLPNNFNFSSDVSPLFRNMITQTGLSKKQKQVLNRPDVRFNITDSTGSEQEAAIDSLLDQGSAFENLGDPDDPATKQDIKKFYGIDV